MLMVSDSMNGALTFGDLMEEKLLIILLNTHFYVCLLFPFVPFVISQKSVK